MDLSGRAKAVGGEPRLPYRLERRPTEPRPTVAAPPKPRVLASAPPPAPVVFKSAGHSTGAPVRGVRVETEHGCAGAQYCHAHTGGRAGAFQG
jgi:hypothetical protein